MIGKYGVDERNEAGEDFLQFCTVNHLTVMNTWFQKKRVPVWYMDASSN